MNKDKRESFWNKIAPNTPARKLILFVLVFAGIGGVWYVYQSFAYCGANQWSGSCEAVVGNLNVKLDPNKNIVNHHEDAAGSQILTDLGEQKRTQLVWSLGAKKVWQSAPFAFAETPERRRAACVEVVSLSDETAELFIDIALVDNSKPTSPVGLTTRQGALEPTTLTSVCTHIIEGLQGLVDSRSNWSIRLTNNSDTTIGLFRDYVLLEPKTN